nr:immunoglobulin heavy chain junction region [Macaca mulatta]MOY18069.1 immunoglobulin heavy chain junction region [Macaca mulatta]MOY18399.1 immunoglobulin heavy chain junction region [Macaca mulatta]MOY18426.1 immunoglobulin heavy chain junction region [Macaca mulatta]MOY18700.1 immunoglobulin heavy chain junction region [Macaca mulatta]
CVRDAFGGGLDYW